MMKKILESGLIFLLLLIVIGTTLAFQFNKEPRYSIYSNSPADEKDKFMNYSLEEALLYLGDEKPIHYIQKADPDSVRMGEELVKYGQLEDNSNRRISKYFVCTDCHNLQLETDDPADESPERVLEYSRKNDIPFLPASTFYSMYNKRHWYNGDYAKKYGDLVKDTRDSLYNAIQLCATQCSQGREMDFWEIRCVMHYYKSLELKLSDLVFEKGETEKLWKLSQKNKPEALALLKTKYNEINDAHFGDSKIPVIEGYEPNFENGAFIYKNGCLHCHAPEKNITNFDLKVDPLSFKFLANKKEKYNHYSITHITRYGTYAISGRKQYMPQYSFDDMSDEQLLDLIFYIETKAEE